MSTDYTNVNEYLVPSFALPTGSTPPLGKIRCDAGAFS